MRAGSRLLYGLWAVGLGWLPVAAPAAEPFPYDLAVQVVYGEPAGPQVVRGELEREIVETLLARACYRRVGAAGETAPAEADLLLRLTVDDYLEEVRYDVSVGDRATSYDPEARQQLTAQFDAALHIELLQLPERSAVRRDTIRVRKTVRPIMPGHEDEFARLEARRQAVRELVLGTAARVCKGSAKKLERQIEKARSAPRPR